MAEKINSKRVVFLKGKQRSFIDKILSKISIEEAAKFCNLSERTIRDWRREKFLMGYKALRILCDKSHLSLPRDVKLKNRYWYVKKGASMGGKALIRKYGKVLSDPERRKKKWYEWWEKEGKYKSHTIFNLPKPIKKPNFSKKLAEFVGIVLGDGGISQYQVTITLHAIDDRAYGNFVVKLIQELFKIPIGIYPSGRDAVIDYVVSRIELVRFLEKIGLKQGNKVKQQVDIPEWIKRNKEYRIACVRGLVDTDGSVFIHRYKVKGKEYAYKKLLFTSHSELLRQSVFKILSGLGTRVRLDNGHNVCIDSKVDVAKYFEIIGSHNPKHLNRYQK